MHPRDAGCSAWIDGPRQGVALYGNGANDAPTATGLTQSLSATEDTPSAPLGIVVTDVDAGDTITAKLTLSAPSAGSLTTAGGGSYTAATGYAVEASAQPPAGATASPGQVANIVATAGHSLVVNLPEVQAGQSTGPS